MKSSMLFDERSYVFTQNRNPSQRKGRRHRRFAGLALATERDCLPPDAYGASVERQDTTATQNKSHDRTQEIGRCILVGERRQTGAPNPLRGTIYKKKCLVAIGEFKKFSGSVRS